MVHSIPRIFIPTDATFEPLQTLILSLSQSHYLLNVMRLEINDRVHLFNGRDGEWEGYIIGIHKGMATICLDRMLRGQPQKNSLILIFAPIKKHRLSILIEKATELGATHFIPIKTDYTNAILPPVERLSLIAIEAAEQSQRMEVPLFDSMISLASLLKQWPESCPLYLGDERRTAPSLLSIPRSSPAAFLIGPEGGFSEVEFTLLDSHPCVRPIRLSASILRSETAALSALAIWQAEL